MDFLGFDVLDVEVIGETVAEPIENLVGPGPLREYDVRREDVEIAIKILTVVALGALELWAAVPAGFALGLHPILTAVSAALGAVLAVLVVLVLGERARAWIGRREPSTPSSHRSLRAVWTRYGVAGLGLAAPLLVGAPLGTVLGLLLGAQPSQLLRWMVLGVVGWSVLLTLAAVMGLVGLESLG